VRSVLGRGATATVYCAARHCSAGAADAAVKVLRDPSAARGAAAASHQGAAEKSKRPPGHAELAVLRDLRRLGLRGVAQLMGDPVWVDGRLLVALEKCRSSLHSLVGCCCPLPALHGLARSLLSVVAELHTAGFVHGDIKPSNVLWSATQAELKLADFGLSFRTARVEAEPKEEKGDCSSQTSGALNPVSSGGYRAPEGEAWNSMSLDERREAVRLDDKPCGPACDAWSCGVVLCELFAGERLWPTALASAPCRAEACDHAAVATTALLGAPVDAAADAHNRWRQQVARARELLGQRVNAKAAAMEAKALHFGGTMAATGSSDGIQASDEQFSAHTEREARHFGELVMSLLRFHTDTLVSPPPRLAGKERSACLSTAPESPRDALSQPASINGADGSSTSSSLRPNEALSKRRRLDDPATTESTSSSGSAAVGAGRAGEEEEEGSLFRLDCATALKTTRYFATRRGRGGGGVTVVSTTAPASSATALNTDSARDEQGRPQEQPGQCCAQQSWAWEVSLLPTRFLLVHGLLAGDEDDDELAEVCERLSCSHFPCVCPRACLANDDFHNSSVWTFTLNNRGAVRLHRWLRTCASNAP
jgi:serine/threonine protein kinase